MADRAADFDDGAGALVADRKRILDDLSADAAGGVVMDVGTADADGAELDDYVGRLANLRIGDVSQRHRAGGRSAEMLSWKAIVAWLKCVRTLRRRV